MFSKKKPDCIACGYVKVIPENYEVMDLISRYMNYFVDGMGGLNTNGILNIIDLENVSEKIKTIYKIQYYIVSYMNKKYSDLDKPNNSEEITNGKTSFKGNISSRGQRVSPGSRR
jgi:hypothetical protein